VSKRRDHADVLVPIAYHTGTYSAVGGECVFCRMKYAHTSTCPIRRAREILGRFTRPEQVWPVPTVTPPSDNRTEPVEEP
jgi:hypothetical protein